MNRIHVRPAHLLEAVVLGVLVITLAAVLPYPGSGKPIPVWTVALGQRIVSPPLPLGSALLVQTTAEVIALSPTTGALVWRADGPRDSEFAVNGPRVVPLQATENTIVAAYGNGPVIAYSAADGAVLWMQPDPVTSSPAVVTALLVSNGMVFVARYNSYLTAYDLVSGRALWSVDVPSRSISFLSPGATGLVFGNTVALQLLDYATGVERAHAELEGTVGTMYVTDSAVYIGSAQDSGVLAAYDLPQLNLLWIIPRGKAPVSLPFEVTSVTAANDVLYVSGTGLAAVSAADGRVIWTDRLHDDLGGVWIYGDHAYVRGARKVYVTALSDGRLESSLTVPQTLLTLHSIFPPLDVSTASHLVLAGEGSRLFAYPIGAQ